MRKSIVLTALFMVVSVSAGCFASDYVLVKGNPEAKVAYYNPAWSPDGSAIAYVRGTNYDPQNPFPWVNDANLYIARQVNGIWKHRLILSHADTPVWSKSGLLAFQGERGLMLYDPRTGTMRRLTSPKREGTDGDDDFDYPSEFSPKNRFLAFERGHYEGGEIRVYDLKSYRDLGIMIDDESGWSWSPNGRQVLGLLSPNTVSSHPVLSNKLMLWDLETLKWRIILRKYDVMGIYWPRKRHDPLVYIEDPMFWKDLPEFRPEDLKPPKGKGWYKLNLKSRRLTLVSHEALDYFPVENRYADIARKESPSGNDLHVIDTTSHKKYLISHQLVRTAGNFHQAGWDTDWSPDRRSLAYVTVGGNIMIHRF